jgi:signal recognition particle subunit SRP19
MRKRRDYYVIWPAYFEASKKRREGRRVNLRLSIDKIKLSEILLAAEKLGYKGEIIQEKSYPKSCWEKGCVIIYPKKDKKTELLRKLAITIKDMRKVK